MGRITFEKADARSTLRSICSGVPGLGGTSGPPGGEMCAWYPFHPCNKTTVSPVDIICNVPPIIKS